MQNNLILKIDRRIGKILLQRSTTSRQNVTRNQSLEKCKPKPHQILLHFHYNNHEQNRRKRKQIPLSSTNYWQGRREIEMYTMLVGIENNRAAMENWMTALQKIKVNYCVIQKFYFWYMQSKELNSEMQRDACRPCCRQCFPKQSQELSN